ncbi:hypothetical protein NWP21_10055 [Anabaenopsis sp. FSS-46]|uniref:hypothetical protein n=1 Tax=Anabaenopsis sp. FSS-46 TaxID=2971766 RepID=UPI002473848B|nr:hypothetical protein [Anabaenopsis sp. FSS-46]MDH6099177.1 hypothetical protein [Anabaenopsis sp. FSS-46]
MIASVLRRSPLISPCAGIMMRFDPTPNPSPYKGRGVYRVAICLQQRFAIALQQRCAICLQQRFAIAYNLVQFLQYFCHTFPYW